MARIAMTSGFTVIPEGTYIFRIYGVEYDEEFGKMQVKLVTAQGLTHTERFMLKNKDDEPNEGALNAFSYFAKTALNDFTVEDIDHTDLIDCYIEAEVEHTVMPSNKDPNKKVTFCNLGNKSPADGFDEEPVPKALTLGKENEEKPTSKPKSAKSEKAAEKPKTKKKFDASSLDELLG